MAGYGRGSLSSLSELLSEYAPEYVGVRPALGHLLGLSHQAIEDLCVPRLEGVHLEVKTESV